MLMGLVKVDDAAEAFRSALARDPAALQAIAKLDAAMARRSPAVTPHPPAAAPRRARADADLFGLEFLNAEPRNEIKELPENPQERRILVPHVIDYIQL